MTYFIIFLLLIINFTGTILLFNGVSSAVLPYEIMILGLLLLVSIISLYGAANKKSASYAVLSVIFALSLVNIAYLSFSIDKSLILLLILADSIGFILSVLNIKTGKRRFKLQTYNPDEDDLEEDEIVVEEIKPTVYKMKKEFKPGKYIASSKSIYYHTAKCDWGKKISKRNQVWLADDEDARKKGYKKHSCLKSRTKEEILM